MARFRGTSADDDIVGTGDADIITGGSGDDVVNGGLGNDNINGGAGSDDLFGGGGDDTIDGGSGSDDIFGGDGDDTIDGGSGFDTITGGDDLGDDPILYDGSTLIEFELGDVLSGRSGRDTFVFDGDDHDHDLITDFIRGQDTLRILDAESVLQVVITSGPYGSGLLIITDEEGDDGLFLQGVNAPLTIGTDIILDDNGGGGVFSLSARSGAFSAVESEFLV